LLRRSPRTASWSTTGDDLTQLTTDDCCNF